MVGIGTELMLRSKLGFLWNVRVIHITPKSVDVAIVKGIDKAFWSMSCSGLQKAIDAARRSNRTSGS